MPSSIETCRVCKNNLSKTYSSIENPLIFNLLCNNACCDGIKGIKPIIYFNNDYSCHFEHCSFLTDDNRKLHKHYCQQHREECKFSNKSTYNKTNSESARDYRLNKKIKQYEQEIFNENAKVLCTVKVSCTVF
jgi:hypothetical protein